MFKIAVPVAALVAILLTGCSDDDESTSGIQTVAPTGTTCSGISVSDVDAFTQEMAKATGISIERRLSSYDAFSGAEECLVCCNDALQASGALSQTSGRLRKLQDDGLNTAALGNLGNIMQNIDMTDLTEIINIMLSTQLPVAMAACGVPEEVQIPLITKITTMVGCLTQVMMGAFTSITTPVIH